MNLANHFSMTSIWVYLQSWPWWLGGLGLGLTAVALAWFTGRRLGVTGGYEDACSVMTKDESSYNVSPSLWKMWFILGLPLGGFIANIGHWSWTWLFGRLDAFTFGNSFWKIVWLFIGGILIGFGARWAGGCTSGHSILGVSLGNKMSILATVAFLVAGILFTNLLMKVM
ncbi:MAG TPA: YeeE/YedE thiosulfate transporter family protein [bacterium]